MGWCEASASARCSKDARLRPADAGARGGLQVGNSSRWRASCASRKRLRSRPPAKPVSLPAADHAMAGQDERNGIGAVRRAHRTTCCRPADRAGDLAVAARFTEGKGREHGQDFALEVGDRWCEVEIEDAAESGEVGVDLRAHRGEPVGRVGPGRIRFEWARFALELQPMQAFLFVHLRSDEHQRADRRGHHRVVPAGASRAGHETQGHGWFRQIRSDRYDRGPWRP